MSVTGELIGGGERSGACVQAALARELDTSQHAQRLEAMGSLASGMAHDFSNELQIIRGAIALIADTAEPPDRLERGIHILNEVVDRAGSVVRRLLAYAREDVLHTSRIDVRDLLFGLREALRLTLPRQLHLNVNVPADANLTIWADTLQLQTVLLNLANNARHAMPNGGTLTLAASLDEDIEVTAAGLPVPRATYVRLDVADTGSGMSPSTLARASEPFFTTKGPGQGTGLGLSMARGFAEQSGGALAITSTLGQGTLVSVWLPVANPDAEDVEPAAGKRKVAPPVPACSQAPNVVLVDDVKFVRDAMARQLVKEGIKVSVAEASDLALEIIAGRESVDLVVTDYAMPDATGVDLIRRAHLVRPELPVILLTGHPLECDEFLKTYPRRELVTVMSKPVSGVDIVQAISSVLDAAEISTGPT